MVSILQSKDGKLDSKATRNITHWQKQIWLGWKAGKKMFHANVPWKHTGIIILKSYKVNFQPKLEETNSHHMNKVSNPSRGNNNC
jgi:hypothetical protein